MELCKNTPKGSYNNPAAGTNRSPKAEMALSPEDVTPRARSKISAEL
jgi:hypothetical protein